MKRINKEVFDKLINDNNIDLSSQAGECYLIYESMEEEAKQILIELLLQAQAMNISIKSSFKYMFGISINELENRLKELKDLNDL